jgi:AcrR family transcriptional regulator
MPKIVKDTDIYSAVIQVVTARGYAGATTKQMAEAANVSEVTLFRKYGSKPQLVKQAISAIMEQTSFDSAAQFTGDITADLLRVVTAYQESASYHGQFFAVLLVELHRYPEVVDLVNDPFEIFQRIAQLLARYQSEGILRQEHPMQALAALLGPIMVYVSLLRNAMPAVDLPPLDLEDHVAGFLEGHRVVPKPS